MVKVRAGGLVDCSTLKGSFSDKLKINLVLSEVDSFLIKLMMLWGKGVPEGRYLTFSSGTQATSVSESFRRTQFPILALATALTPWGWNKRVYPKLGPVRAIWVVSVSSII